MNFESFSNQLFKVGFDYYQRTYSVLKKTNGFIRMINVMDGTVLFENLNPSDLTIDGAPVQNLEQLQNIVFNRSCFCDLENVTPEPFKYFDLSFDETFE